MTTPSEAPNLNYVWAGMLVEELVRLDVAGFVLSPGSRNAPLAISVALHPRARYWVHFDERGAAFFALGLARQSGRPAVLICTSGSAVANYWPAVVEASASGIPLVIVSADRPPELLDCGANQAIDQPHLFGRYARWETVLPCPSADIEPAFVLTTVDQAVFRSQMEYPGPVHIDCMFREPLAPAMAQPIPEGYLKGVARWQATRVAYTRYSSTQKGLGDAVQAGLLDAVQTAARGVLVFGALAGADEVAQAAILARTMGWPVFADICTGLRGIPAVPGLLPYGDLMLLDAGAEQDWMPDLVVHIGGPVVSKRLQQALERWRPEYVRVCTAPARRDPGHCVSMQYSVPPASFCAWLAACMAGSPPVEVAVAWVRRNEACARALAAWEAAQEALSEILVARLIASNIPDGSLLFLGNSLPVRLMDSFGYPAGQDVLVAANRGASGIDGNVATAAGMAVASNRPATALVGDLTLLHDLNSLALTKGMSAPFVVVVLNNDGGGIFHHLPISGYGDVFESCFGTPHGLSFAGAAAQFQVPYVCPATRSEFCDAYVTALGRPGPTLIEVTVDRTTAHTLHLELRELLRLSMTAFS